MPEIILPQPGPHMVEKLDHPARHKILCMGRRWRKTTLGILAAIQGHGPRRDHVGALHGGNIWFIDQDHPSATSVWLAIRGILRPIAKHISEADRRILLHGDGAITLRSASNHDRLVGDIRGIDGVVMNEGAKFNPLVWQKAMLPALSDRKGWSIWPSTPEGFNYFKDLHDAAPTLDGWAAWREPSSSNPFWDPKEIDLARAAGMPDNLVRQEFFAEFILMGAGRTYYEFNRAAHIRDHELDGAQPLDLCISFGMAPSAWVVAQGDRDAAPERAIDEIVPPGGDPSVRAFLDEFRRRYPAYSRGDKVRVFGEIYGKSSGRSDYEQVRAGLIRAQHFARTTPFDEKDRTNAVNMMLRDGRGEVRAFVSPSCSQLIRDLEGMRNTDASYRVDHRKPGLGWFAAAWGAKVARQYPALLDVLKAARSPESSRWAGKRPEQTPRERKCYSLYWTAVRAGKIKRPDACEQCGKVGPVEADHRDHDSPYDVTHLCYSCHRNMPPAGGTVQSAVRPYPVLAR